MNNVKIFTVSYGPDNSHDRINVITKFEQEVASFQKERIVAKTTWLQSSWATRCVAGTQLTVIFEY